MAYQALYRKWRPSVFDDVAGQPHITRTLKNEIITGKVAHAYIFTGIRGTGKTSTAKIFSRAINCLDNQDGNPCNKCEICLGIKDGSILDVIEIDAASNNSVDDVREIREEVVYTAARTNYKVYIIDEVHMLSSGAFNALLKTLEEPPPHIVFILATTEVHKLPATILSRCQRFDFRRITPDDISVRLQEVTQKDGIEVEDEAIRLVSNLAEGSMRDALSILDRCIALGAEKITLDDIISVLGIADNEVVNSIASASADGNAQNALESLEGAIKQGKSAVQICDGLIKHFRDLLICKVSNKPETVLEVSQDKLQQIKIQSEKFSHERLIRAVQLLSNVYGSSRYLTNPRIALELAIVKLCSPIADKSPEGLMDRLVELEKRMAQGVPTMPQQTPDLPKFEEVKKNSRKLIKGPLTQIWGKLLEELKIKEHNLLAGCLPMGKPSQENGVLHIVFNSEMDETVKIIDKEENRNIISDIIEELTGNTTRVKLETTKGEISYSDDEIKTEKLKEIPGIEIVEE